ncbi:MAG: biopolymer transporter ExbD [Planctomycetota bacterium]|nr:biopolymer transporter ExbD [Planctomycetota bacterium]
MPLKTSQDEQASLNMTPMIDIVFLLIIFFMVGTRFTELEEAEQQMPLEVPHLSRAGTLTHAPSKRVINVYHNSIQLDSKQVTLEQLETDLAEARSEYPKVGVVVRGESEIVYQRIAEVLGTVHAAGIKDMRIAVKTGKNLR